MRFYEKPNKSLLSDEDIFIISSGSGSNWEDYRVTWAQMQKMLPSFTPFQTDSSITISNEADIASIFINTNRGENFLISGTVVGTASAANTTVNLAVYLDGDLVFTISQVCAAGGNSIPVNVGVEAATAGNHVINIICSVINGTFTI